MLLRSTLLRSALLSLLLCSPTLFYGQKSGIKPRPDPRHYPVAHQVATATLAAAQLPAKQVRRSFASDLWKDYVVVEIGVFPKSQLRLSRGDFLLRIKGEADVIRPLEPETIAATITEKKQKNLDVNPVVGVRWESGPNPNDPGYYNGQNQGSRVNTTAGATVGVSEKEKSRQALEAERKAIIAELLSKSLPEGTVTEPVAGYLYFPAPTDKPPAYELEFDGSGSVILSLPSPRQ
ncbi:MAG TPA: hypothetical protein VN577_13165 [Terriglobales bacterium]|nr:hypothetical protein [Terriglobales bacterium]